MAALVHNVYMGADASLFQEVIWFSLGPSNRGDSNHKGQLSRYVPGQSMSLPISFCIIANLPWIRLIGQTIQVGHATSSAIWDAVHRSLTMLF